EGEALRPGDMVIVPDKAFSANTRWKSTLLAAQLVYAVGVALRVGRSFYASPVPMAKSHALLLVFLLAQMNSQAQAGHESRESDRTPEKMASSYVPLDSWIYPAFE